MESLDEDKFDRNVAPVTVSVWGTGFKSHDTENPYFNNVLNYYMDHVWDGFYTGQKHLSRFPSLIYTGLYYNVTLSGTYPGKVKLQLLATENRDKGVVMTFFYTDPQSIQVWNGGSLVQAIEYQAGGGVECSPNDPHATNRWFH